MLAGAISSVFITLSCINHVAASSWHDFVPEYLHQQVQSWLDQQPAGQTRITVQANDLGEYAIFSYLAEASKWPVNSVVQSARKSDYGCKALYRDADVATSQHKIPVEGVITSFGANVLAPTMTPDGLLATFQFRCHMDYAPMMAILERQAGPLTTKSQTKKKYDALEKGVREYDEQHFNRYGPWKATCPCVGETIDLVNGRAECKNKTARELQVCNRAARDKIMHDPNVYVGNYNALTNRRRTVTPPVDMLTVFLESGTTSRCATSWQSESLP